MPEQPTEAGDELPTITAVASAANAGLRQAHLQPRSQTGTGRARIGRPSRYRSRSSANAAARHIAVRALRQALQANRLQVARQIRAEAVVARPARRPQPGAAFPGRSCRKMADGPSASRYRIAPRP